MPRLFAIGDIHGCAASLRHLLQIVPIQPEDCVVTLGDYINRGPDSKGVIEQMLELQKRCQLIPLMGNHEQMLLRAMESPEAEELWRMVGGNDTLQSYGVGTIRELPDHHLDFIRSCRFYHEAERNFFVHARVDPFVPLDAQVEDALLWQHLNEAPPRHISGKNMICGHTPQMDGFPRHYGTAICIDTGAGTGGWVTCLEITPRGYRYWQANEQGKTRSDVLMPPEEDE
jgi:serine/threonine protein phosphatase 1